MEISIAARIPPINVKDSDATGFSIFTKVTECAQSASGFVPARELTGEYKRTGKDEAGPRVQS